MRLPVTLVAVVLALGVLVLAACGQEEAGGGQPEVTVPHGGADELPSEPTETGDDVALPPPGAVEPHVLRDGTEVFVVHVEAGVFAVEAESPMSHGGTRLLVGWCARSERFEEPYYASAFDAAGHWTGGPASRGLAPRRVRVVEGRVLIGEPLPEPARDATSPIPANSGIAPTCAESPVLNDPGIIRHHVPSGAAGMTPQERLANPDPAPLPVTGSLERVGAATLRICSAPPPAHDAGPVCTAESVPVEPVPFEWLDLDSPHYGAEPGQSFGAHGTYLMSVHDDRLRVHAILPALWEYGGWAAGTEPIVATGRLSRPADEASRVDLVGGRPGEDPMFVLLEPDGTRHALYPSPDVMVTGGATLVSPDVGGVPTSLERLHAVLDEGVDLTVRVTIRRRDGATFRIDEHS